MTWAEEVAAGERDVKAGLTKAQRRAIRGVPIIAQETWGRRPMWGSWEPQRRVITLYRPAFDQMPDPENRERQIRAVIGHELEHAFGHPGHVSDGMPNGDWYVQGPFDIELHDGRLLRWPQ